MLNLNKRKRMIAKAMPHLIPLLFTIAAIVALASLASDARRFIRAARDLARYLEGNS